MLLDGIEKKSYHSVSGPVFSLDSRHLVYFAQEHDKHFAVVDGDEGTVFDSIECFSLDPPTFDAPSEFFYTARLGNEIYRVEERIAEE